MTNQIISDFDGLYLKGVDWRQVKFIGVPSLNIIQYIYDTYVTLNQVYIDENGKKMRDYYDATLPIEVLFDQIVEGMEVAEAGRCLCNKNKIVQKSYFFIIQTGRYKEACIKWNPKAMRNQLWLIFKEHFSKAHSENRNIEQATSQVSGFTNAVVYKANKG